MQYQPMMYQDISDKRGKTSTLDLNPRPSMTLQVLR
jgi:hypothetical protein